jgi:hypothetical protein
MLVVAFRTFLWPSYQVSDRTWCKHAAPSTIHFTIRRRDKHSCTVDQLTHDWVKLPFAPLVCGVRRCCQLSYTVVTSILLVFSPQKILSRIFLIRPRTSSLQILLGKGERIARGLWQILLTCRHIVLICMQDRTSQCWGSCHKCMCYDHYTGM